MLTEGRAARANRAPPPADAELGSLSYATYVQQPGSGGSIDLQFLFGVQQPGFYRFFVNVEAGPAPVGTLGSSAARLSSQPNKARVDKRGAGRQQR